MYRAGYDKGKNELNPLTTYLVDRPMQKADLNTSLEWENEYYYPNTDFIITATENELNAYQNQALIYFVDNNTYLYYTINDDVISFTITNGTIGVPIAKYDLVVGDNQLEPEMIEVSDGYLHYFVVNELTTTYFYNTYFQNLLLNYMPNYRAFGINTEPYLLSIGGTNSAINYDNGYNAGYSAGVNDVLDNLGNYHLYTQEQYDDNYTLGFNRGADSITDIGDSGFTRLMNVIFNAPYNIFNGFLNFEVFGVNLFNLLSFIFTTSIALFVVKLIFLKK